MGQTMRKLYVSLLNYTSCKDCAAHFRRDLSNTIIYLVIGYYVYPYLEPYFVLWWLWNIIYLVLMVYHTFMICQDPKSPPTKISMTLTSKIYTLTKSRDAKLFYELKKQWVVNSGLYHFHKDQKGKQKNHETRKQSIAPLTRKEQLEKLLGKETTKLKQWELNFEEWSNSREKQISKLSIKEANVEEQKSKFCLQRNRLKEKIATLQLKSKAFVEKIIEAEIKRKDLEGKRHKFETQTDERLYELKVEKAKLQDIIQKTRFELMIIQDDEVEETPNTKKAREDDEDVKIKRIQVLEKEIEAKEIDLECPVCFEVCMT